MIKLNCKDVFKSKCLVEIKTIITHMTEDKFKFLGALIVNLKRRPSLKRGRSIPLGIKAPIGALIGKLKTTGFLRQNHQALQSSTLNTWRGLVLTYLITIFYRSTTQKSWGF